MAKVGDSAHTPHGLGKITESVTERGRKSFRVAGRGFNVWVDETKLHVANGPLFSMGPMEDIRRKAEEDSIFGPAGAPSGGPTHFAGLESTIEMGPVNEKNHTTLPWDYTPQYDYDLFRDDQNIQPGDHEIDPSKRLRPSDSVSGKSRSDSKGPGPSPDLFAGGGGDNPFDDERTSNLHRYAEDLDDHDGYVIPTHPHVLNHDRKTHDENGAPYGHIPLSDMGDTGNRVEDAIWKTISAPAIGIDKALQVWDNHQDQKAHPGKHEANGQHSWEPEDRERGGIHTVTMGGPEYDSYVSEDHGPAGGRHERFDQPREANLYRPAGLDKRYAHFEIDAEVDNDSPVARFRQDPRSFIASVGHLWTDGDDSLERFASYTHLVDDEAIKLGGLEHTAAWKDVRQKAQRLRHEGAISVADAGPNRVYASVQGDNGLYDVMIYKAGAFGGNQSVLDWACSCDWGRWAFKRKFSYVGRLCSHAYATYLHMQSDHIKKNPISKGAAASVSDYKGWLDDNNQVPEASSIANYLNTQGNGADQDEVEKLYDHASDNWEDTPERDYHAPYTNDPDEAYKQSAVTPIENYHGGNEEKIQHAATMYGTGSHQHQEAIRRFGPHKQADLLRQKPLSLSPNLHVVPPPADNEWVDVTSDDRETTGPDQIMAAHILASLHYEGAGITDFGTDASGASPDGGAAASPAAAPSSGSADPSAGADLGTPAGGSVGGDAGTSLGDTGMSDAGGGFSPDPATATVVPSGLSSGNGEQTQKMGFSHYADSDEALLEKLRNLSTDDDDHDQHWDEHNDEVRKVTDELNDRGYDASQMVANLHAAAQDDETPADGDGDFLGQSSPGFPDQGYAGSGPDPKDWISDSAGYVKENEEPDYEDLTDGDGDIIKYDDGDKPPQGPRHTSRHDYLHYAADEPGTGYFNPNNAGADDWDAASGEQFANDLGQEADSFDPSHAMGGSSAEEGGAAGEGGGIASTIAENPELLALASRQRKQGGFSLEAFDSGEFSFDDAPGGGGELRRISGLGRGHSAPRIDQGARNGQIPGQRPVERTAAEQGIPEDFGYDGGRDFEAYLQEGSDPSGADIVANFHRSGAADGVMQDPSYGSQGGYDDFSQSPMVQSMLRTAGRVYSPDEQRVLEAESHPLGARNMPNEDDLAGTHYVHGL
jgi:hypothetical protein